MGALTLLKAGVRHHVTTMVGTFALVALSAFALTVAVGLLLNSDEYVSQEMGRLGYGDTTVWVSDVDDVDALAATTADIPGVGDAWAQPLIYAGYGANGHHSDDEGQLIAYDARECPYTFLDDDLTAHAEVSSIRPGTVYVSPALVENFDIQVGDVIDFELARTGAPQALTVAGYFEDPFMGSSMIDMKSFLVSSEDYAGMLDRIAQTSSFDALAHRGAMIHVGQEGSGALTPLEFDRVLGQDEQLARQSDFSYSRAAIQDLMVLQQTILAGFLMVFAVALVLVALIVLGNAVSNAIELDRRDIAALKTVGYSNATLRLVQLAYGMLGAAVGMVVGTVSGVLASGAFVRLLVTSAGVLVPSGPRLGWCLAGYAVILLVLAVVVTVKTRRIVAVAPIESFDDGSRERAHAAPTPIGPRALSLSLAFRRIASNRMRYAATFVIAVLLVFFVSAVGRINAWVGPDGEGLMDAFSAADVDVGVQPLNPVDMEGVEQTIGRYDTIVGVYALAMQPVRVNGAAFTANVIDAPGRFHILEGRTCADPGEIVLTRAVADDLGTALGDTVEVSAEGSSQDYEVVGLYQCANEMGANVGMSLEGYSRVGDVRGFIWCYHYILAGGGENEQIATDLQSAYGAAAAIHTNGWSGLAGLVSTMRVLLLLLYGITGLLVLISIALTSGRLLLAERRGMAVFKSIGFTSRQLRVSFALRMGVVVGLGAVAGLVLSGLFADALIAQAMRLFGIGAFVSRLGLVDSVIPAVGIVALSMALAYLFSRQIRRADPVELFADFER